MENQDGRMTEAEKQIRRLEALRQDKEAVSRESADRTFNPHKTQAERTEDRLRALRKRASQPVGRKSKIEGKQKSAKLTYIQIRALEQLLTQDKRLRGSVVTRIALNRFLGLENTQEENDLESRITELLRQLKGR